jgi:TetR/AcrR family transcriptional regulator
VTAVAERGAKGDDVLGRRAARTRQAIIDAARRLFLERGYAGTRISDITDACRISRAGFYTYFRDKREVFHLLGESAYRDSIRVMGLWDSIPEPCALDDVVSWVRTFFAHMDEHGAFIFSSGQSAPEDEEFRHSSERLQMRVAWLLGVSLRRRQRRPTDAPEALGLTAQAMLEHSWFYSRAQRLPVEEAEMIRSVAERIISVFGASPDDGDRSGKDPGEASEAVASPPTCDATGMTWPPLAATPEDAPRPLHGPDRRG